MNVLSPLISCCKVDMKGAEPARTVVSETQMKFFRKLRETYQYRASVKISQVWDNAIQTWEGEECPYQPRNPKQFNAYFYRTWARHLEREQNWQKIASSDARQNRQQRPRDVLDLSPALAQHNRCTLTV